MIRSTIMVRWSVKHIWHKSQGIYVLIVAEITLQDFVWNRCVCNLIYNTIKKKQLNLVNVLLDILPSSILVWVKSLCSSSVSVNNASHSPHHWMGIRELPLMGSSRVFLISGLMGAVQPTGLHTEQGRIACWTSQVIHQHLQSIGRTERTHACWEIVL